MDDINTEQYMKSAEAQWMPDFANDQSELQFGKAPILMSHWLTGVAATI